MSAIVPAFVSFAQDAVVAFVVLVAIDDLLGVVEAIKSKTFDFHKLPSFLASQFGTKEALVVAVAVVGAVATSGESFQALHQSALAVVTAGGGALSLAVLKDIYLKLKAIAGF